MIKENEYLGSSKGVSIAKVLFVNSYPVTLKKGTSIGRWCFLISVGVPKKSNTNTSGKLSSEMKRITSECHLLSVSQQNLKEKKVEFPISRHL